jgi:hemoglobin-like flavoprotein
LKNLKTSRAAHAARLGFLRQNTSQNNRSVGTMQPDQIVQVKESFEAVKSIAEQAAALFYGRLFEIAPHVKPLFRGDMTEQGKKLMATLVVVVNGLDKLETILPAASALAKRHVDYGVKPNDYAVVGEALLWTLERGLGAGWTPETARAWQNAYGLLSGFMISEAYGDASHAA